MNEPAFTYDVFLSHSAKDKAVVPPVADLSRRSHAAEAEGRAANRLSTLNYQSSTIWRLGLGAVGGGHVPVPRPAEQGASLHSPAVRRRLHKRLPGAIPLHQLALHGPRAGEGGETENLLSFFVKGYLVFVLPPVAALNQKL